MRILGWTLAGLVALLLGSGFAFLSESLALGAVTAMTILLIAAYLAWEADGSSTSARDGEGSDNGSSATAYGAPYAKATNGEPTGGDGR